MRKLLLLLTLLSCLVICSPVWAGEHEKPAEEQKKADSSKYLKAVQEFADNVLKYGRDTYGPKHTPLFVDGLNIHTHEPVKWINPDGEKWILSNFASQQTLLRTLDGLSSIMGDPEYRDAAKEAIKYAFENLRSPNGLFYWGHYVAYDAQADEVKSPSSKSHILKRHYPYYELMWRVDPKATQEVIEAYWSAHILDWSNLDFNRMARYSDFVEEPWNHEYKGGPVFFKSKSGALGFLVTGSSLVHAGTTLHRLSGQEQPLVWSKRLAKRFVDTRHKNTGISRDFYNAPETVFASDLKEHFADPHVTYFPWPLFEEARGTYSPENANGLQWISTFLVGELLKGKGEDFTLWALEELTAWGKSAYRKRDNSFIPILTDGTNIEGYACKETNKLAQKGSVVKPLFAGLNYFWIYAVAYDATGDEFMWEMLRDIGFGNSLGDIGKSPEDRTELKKSTTCSDVYGLLGFLELHDKTNRPSFLQMAKRIGDNIVGNQMHKGFFVPSKKHIYTKFDCFEPLALLHLVAAIESKSETVPRVWPSCAMFVPPYRYKQGGVDRLVIYALTESPELPLSLQEAASIGDIDLVRSLLAKGIGVDSWDDSLRRTALQDAAMRGHREVVRLLIAKGARINAKEDWPGGTPLHYAAEQGHKAVAGLLIAKGADIEAKRTYPAGDTPLHSAARKGRKDIVDLLINKGANVNTKNGQGETALDVVGSQNRSQISELLVANGAKISSIHVAARLGAFAEVKGFLDKGVDVNAKDEDGKTPLHLAVQEGHKDVVEALLSNEADVNAKDGKSRTPLHVAVERRNKDVADLLIKKGADVNAKNDNGDTPLDIGGYNKEIAPLLMSAGARTSSIHRAALWGLVSEVKRFLEEGVDVNAKNEDGWAPLHLAAQAGRIDVMELLISKRADVNARNPKGKTPLHITLWQREQETVKESIDLLLSKGADLNAKDGSGSTVLDDAAFGSEREIFEFLLSKGAKINNIHFAAYQGDVDRVKDFLKENVDINEKRTTKERTPLDYAVRGGKVEAVKLLISEGADVNKDTSALINAVQSGDTEIAGLLLDNGADPNAVTGGNRMTVLHTAVFRRNKEMVQLLIKNGAGVNAKVRGRTALDLAKMFKNTEIIELLKKHGAKDGN